MFLNWKERKSHHRWAKAADAISVFDRRDSVGSSKTINNKNLRHGLIKVQFIQVNVTSYRNPSIYNVPTDLETIDFCRLGT